jgi:hypothetical protein
MGRFGARKRSCTCGRMTLGDWFAVAFVVGIVAWVLVREDGTL